MQSQALELTSLNMRKMSRGGGEIILRKKKVGRKFKAGLLFYFAEVRETPQNVFNFHKRHYQAFPLKIPGYSHQFGQT